MVSLASQFQTEHGRSTTKLQGADPWSTRLPHARLDSSLRGSETHSPPGSLASPARVPVNPPRFGFRSSKLRQSGGGA
ncbi:hypothetical protein BRADI_3g22845v3 [Brachypodium distachyon]|uniref:Uncharacterized protein n=1 Tax=Brachypodium distachyon TaxID=15368 RepID=A0A2K2CYW8_BRADI|nr:hypothetical protein BRADI_3g22845v3 [Brachypodium distachyon]